MAERRKEHPHRIPVIDRMMTVLEALEGRQAGAAVADLAQALRIPRTTVYRILNTLEGHRMVARRNEDGGYVLGPRFVRFARFVPELVDIAAAARPTLEALARRVHETVKLSVREGDDAVVVAVVQSPGGYAISTRVGRRFPLHAGAASKVLAAHLPPAELARLIARGVKAITPTTITDPDALRAVLAEVRARGFAADHGEHDPSIHAVAAPVFDFDGVVIAAVSVPFLPPNDQAKPARIRKAVIAAAADITRAIGGAAPAAAA